VPVGECGGGLAEGRAVGAKGDGIDACNKTLIGIFVKWIHFPTKGPEGLLMHFAECR